MHEQLAWTKSSKSNTQGNCVEVAPNQKRILVRDSKHPDAGHITLTSRQWANLRTALATG